MLQSFVFFSIMADKNIVLIIMSSAMVNNMIIAKSLLLIILAVALVGCAKPQKPETTQNDAITIATTFYPLYDLTKSITGNKDIVYSIVPAGTEPHEYEPTPSDIQKLNNAYAFVTLGNEFKEFEEDLIKSVNLDVKIIPAGKDISLLKISDEEGHLQNGNDPHIWLSPKNAQKMAVNIMNGMVDADPTNAQIYLKNGQTLIEQLKLLDKEFKDSLTTCKKDVVLVSHNAFAYLARDYSFRTITISGLEPEAEPTPQQLANLINEAKQYSIKYVFYEELVDPRIAETIAREVGAEILKLSPIEGITNPSDTYLTLMKQNLNNLKTALECK